MGANIVSNDINAAKAAADLTSTAYIDIMVTDGQPLMASGYQDQGAIDGVITAIKALQPANKAFVDSIQFNTAYYFNIKDAGAVSRLTDMAAQGGGSYYEFSSEHDLGQHRAPRPLDGGRRRAGLDEKRSDEIRRRQQRRFGFGRKNDVGKKLPGCFLFARRRGRLRFALSGIFIARAGGSDEPLFASL
jgi:hypothetical protein